MRILLVNPTIRDTKPPYVFPIGLGLIAALLRENGHEIVVYDQNALRVSNQKLCRDLKSIGPVDVVGLGGLITIYRHLKTLTPALREIFPNTPIVLGGGVTLDPAVIFENLPVDFCVHGEGERTVVELCAMLEGRGRGGDFSSIPGISYRDRGKLVQTAPRPIERNLDIFPMPAYDLFPTEIYFQNNFLNEVIGRDLKTTRTASLIWSRGCPNECSFCWRMAGKTMRFRSYESVMEEIAYLRSHYDVDSYLFVDECINASPKKFIGLAEALIERGFQAPWYSHARVNHFTDDVARAVARSGCVGLNFGIESASPKMLKVMNKHATPEEAAEAVAIAEKHGIQANCTFIVGLPGEDRETVLETVDWIKENRIKRLAFFYATPYPGTVIYNLPLTQQRIRERYGTRDRFFSALGDVTDFLVNMTELSDDEVRELPQWARRKLGPEQGYRPPGRTFRPKELLRPFLKMARSNHWETIVFYGSGMHTVRVLKAVDFDGLRIIGIIDDDEKKWGETLRGITVMSMEQALEAAPDAVLLSSDRYENAMLEKCAPFLEAGVPVVRLYQQEETDIAL